MHADRCVVRLRVPVVRARPGPARRSRWPTSSTATRSPWCTARSSCTARARRGSRAPRRSGRPQVRHEPRAGPRRARAADRARGGGGLHIRLRARAVGQHLRRPPARPGGAGDRRTKTPLVQRPVRRPLQRGAAALGSRRPAGRGPRRGRRPTHITEKVLGGTAYAARSAPTRPRPQELEVTGVPYFLIGGAWPDPGRAGRRDAGDRAAPRLVTPRPLSRGSRRPSPRWCWDGGRRSGPPSRPPTSSA